MPFHCLENSELRQNFKMDCDCCGKLGGNGSGLVGTGQLCALIAAVWTVDPLKKVARRLKPNWNVERSSSSCLRPCSFDPKTIEIERDWREF